MGVQTLCVLMNARTAHGGFRTMTLLHDLNIDSPPPPPNHVGKFPKIKLAAMYSGKMGKARTESPMRKGRVDEI